MPALDKLIDMMAARKANTIQLQTDHPACFMTAQGPVAAMRKPLTTAHVVNFLKELARPDERSKLDAAQSCEFVYRDHRVRVLFSEGRVRAQIGAREVSAADEPAPPTPAEAPQAPAPAPVSSTDGRKITYQIDPLFYEMIERGASDLHLSAGEHPLLRIDGVMVKLDHHPATDAGRMKELLWPITPEKNRAQFDELMDTDFAYEIEDLARFRCNYFADRFGMGAVFRQIPTDIVDAEQLGLPKEVLQLCWLSKGFVVVTGPTGSGKSTTLAALVDLINRQRTDHIITIEDPIEFVHANKKCLINQREVGIHTMSFRNALRAALREDPDIVLVGEMRDLETIAIAIETAETGHLVFGTLHTSTAASTVDRIIDQFPADRQGQIRVMLSESLKGIIAQTLCKKIGGGRVAAFEILLVNAAISNLIREGKTFQIPSMMQTQKAIGNRTLNDALLELIVKKQVEPEEAYVKAIDKVGFTSMLERENIRLKIAD